MDAKKENYFELLGLDPSESNQSVIESKINEQEKKWRDLVTKLGKPEHKRLLELVPDIRDKMLNPEKRKAEAQAAILASAIDTAKLDAVRKALPDNYAKIEESLGHLKYTDIYDFLSRDPASGNRTGRFNTTDSAEELVAHAKELNDKYRIKPDSTAEMQLASLVADFLTEEHKAMYDDYIVRLVKSLICKKADVFNEANGEITNEQFAKMSSEFTRVYFTQKEVSAFARDYCEYRGYKISAPKKHTPPNPAPINTPIEPTPVGDDGEPANNPFDFYKQGQFDPNTGGGGGTPQPSSIKPQKNMIAGALGVVLGIIGAHNFFIGRRVRACVQLSFTALSIISLGRLPLFWIPMIWGAIEGFLIYNRNTEVTSDDPHFDRFWVWAKENKKVTAPIAGGVAISSFVFPLIFALFGSGNGEAVPAVAYVPYTPPPAVVADGGTTAQQQPPATGTTPQQQTTTPNQTIADPTPSPTPQPRGMFLYSASFLSIGDGNGFAVTGDENQNHIRLSTQDSARLADGRFIYTNYVVYGLNADARWFSAVLNPPHNVASPQLIFTFYGDGRLLYTSSIFNPMTAPQSVNIDVAGVTQFRIGVELTAAHGNAAGALSNNNHRGIENAIILSGEASPNDISMQAAGNISLFNASFIEIGDSNGFDVVGDTNVNSIRMSTQNSALLASGRHLYRNYVVYRLNSDSTWFSAVLNPPHNVASPELVYIFYGDNQVIYTST